MIGEPVPARLKQLSLVLAIVGLGIWLAGVLTGNERAWQAWHVNWLYFTVVSSAGVMFAAAQRIVTARWSRPVVRFIEGYVAWLPVAFVMLLITIFAGKSHIYPWVAVPPTKHEKAIWLGTTFWTLRSVIVFGLITAFSLWYVYTSVRLDVGLLPEAGAKWAKGLRDRSAAKFTPRTRGRDGWPSLWRSSLPSAGS
jgi:Ni/Fe-hydrogenase subunit HybB-like protein